MAINNAKNTIIVDCHKEVIRIRKFTYNIGLIINYKKITLYLIITTKLKLLIKEILSRKMHKRYLFTIIMVNVN